MYLHFSILQMGDKVKRGKKKKEEECRVYFQKNTFMGFFLLLYALQDSQKSPHVLISLSNISKLSHGLLMVLEQAGVIPENWTLIPGVSGLFLPLNLH